MRGGLSGLESMARTVISTYCLGLGESGKPGPMTLFGTTHLFSSSSCWSYLPQRVWRALVALRGRRLSELE
jgi:hypothetical protein